MVTTGKDAGRRNSLVLAIANAIVGSAGPIAISLGGLAGYTLLSVDKTLATAPVTSFNLGVALFTLPAASLLRVLGQRRGFIGGTVFTIFGGLLAAYGLFVAQFWVFAAGLLFVGGGNAFVQQYRFAAADSVPTQFKSSAISFVLAGGVFTGILGPQIVIWTGSAVASVPFAGAFLSIAALGIAGSVALAFLHPQPHHASTVSNPTEPARPLSEIVVQPRFAVALVCAIASYAVMSFVMTGAPLAIVGCGFTDDDAALGISCHVLAMFAPSFFTGRLISRFGAERTVACGLIMLLACSALALSGLELWRFWSALILLGLGWNFGFIGATSMVASSYRPAEKAKVQGFHDFILFGSVALASLMSGAVYNNLGWETLNLIVLPAVATCLVILTISHMRALRHA